MDSPTEEHCRLTIPSVQLAHQPHKKVSFQRITQFSGWSGLGRERSHEFFFERTERNGEGSLLIWMEEQEQMEEQKHEERGRDASRGSQFVKLVTDP